MQIQLTNTYRIPAGVRIFYAVRGVRSGYVVSRWTSYVEAEVDCDARNRTASVANRYDVVNQQT